MYGFTGDRLDGLPGCGSAGFLCRYVGRGGAFGRDVKTGPSQYVLFKADASWSQLNLEDLNPEPSTEFTVDASDITLFIEEGYCDYVDRYMGQQCFQTCCVWP